MTKINIFEAYIVTILIFLLGPAAYNPVFKKSCPIPLCFKASKRFENSKEVTPGPATYEVCQ